MNNLLITRICSILDINPDGIQTLTIDVTADDTPVLTITRCLYVAQVERIMESFEEFSLTPIVEEEES